jgi:ABC-type branched-subunit amino acid transport system ATPase component
MEIRSNEGQFQGHTISLSDNNFIVLVGSNNSGKSTLLREVVKTFPAEALRVDVNRTVLRGEGPQEPNYASNLNGYLNGFRQQNDDNTEKNLHTLQDFFRLKDVARHPIIAWYNQYFPNHIYEERQDPENTASPLFLKVNGYSITKQGSGMRATLDIFIRLFDPAIKILCIDEPELGLEPYLQKYLFQAIKDKASADKKIIIATHSHHFLDLENPENNFICKRDTNDKIYIEHAVDLENVIFRLLGNSLSSFLLPEKVLILEGPSDTTFLLTALRLLSKEIYSIHNSRGIGNVSYAMQAITQFLRFNHEYLSVYNEKMYVIVDRPGRDILIREWERLVPSPDRICTLSQNGIEYYYPEPILRNIFNTPDTKQQIIDGYLRSRNNTYNGIQKSKVELSKIVSNQLQAGDLNDQNNELFVFLNALPAH